MIFWKVFQKTKLHLLVSLILFSFLFYFFYKVKRQVDSSNVDYSIRDYSIKNLNIANYGKWKKFYKNNTELFNEESGDVEFILFGDSTEIENSLWKSGFKRLIIHFHERIEISSTNATLSFYNGYYNAEKDSLNFPIQTVDVRTIKADEFFALKKCTLQAQMKLIWSSASHRYKQNVFIESEDCPEFQMAVQTSLLSNSLKQSQVILHTLFTLLVISIKIASLAMLDFKLQDNLVANNQVSTMTILSLGTIQLIFGFEQLVLSLFDFPYFFCLILLGIVYFNLFFFLVLKTVATSIRFQIIYRMQNNPEFNLRTFLLFVYCQSHITILGTFFVSLRFIDSPYLFYIWGLAILPQIVKNCMSNTRFLTPKPYISIFYLTSMIYTLYMHFFKFNFFSINSQQNAFSLIHGAYILCFCLGLVFLTVIQEHIHPSFFIPKQFRRVQGFDYFFGLKELRNGKWSKKQADQCIICFSNLDKHYKQTHEAHKLEIKEQDNVIDKHLVVDDMAIESQKDIESNLSSVESEVEWRDCVHNEALKDFLDDQMDSNKFMGTPCDHVFHTSCLLVWMNRKMDCPVCRTKLPPVV